MGYEKRHDNQEKKDAGSDGPEDESATAKERPTKAGITLTGQAFGQTLLAVIFPDRIIPDRQNGVLVNLLCPSSENVKEE